MADRPINAALVEQLHNIACESFEKKCNFYGEIAAGRSFQATKYFSQWEELRLALSDIQGLDFIYIELFESDNYRKETYPKSQIRCEAKSHVIEVTSEGRTANETKNFLDSIGRLRGFHEYFEHTDEYRNEKALEGYFTENLDAKNIQNLVGELCSLDAYFRLKVTGITKSEGVGERTHTVLIEALEEFLEENWSRLKIFEIEFKQRGIDFVVHMELPTGFLYLTGVSRIPHPHIRRVSRILEEKFSVNTNHEIASQYRSGTLTYRIKKISLEKLGQRIRGSLKRMKNVERKGDCDLAMGGPFPDVTDAYIIVRERGSWNILNRRPRERLIGFSTVDGFLDTLEDPPSGVLFVAYSVVGAGSVTLNIDLDVEKKIVVAWSTKSLDCLMKDMDFILDGMGEKLVSGGFSGSDSGQGRASDRWVITGIKTSFLAVGQMAKFVLTLLGVSGITFLASADVNLFSRLEITHPDVSGEVVNLPFDAGSDGVQPVEIAWEEHRSSFWPPYWFDRMGAQRNAARITVYRQGVRTVMGVAMATSPWQLQATKPGQYRVDVQVDELRPKSIIVILVEPNKEAE